jgi:hypothetical protein
MLRDYVFVIKANHYDFVMERAGVRIATEYGSLANGAVRGMTGRTDTHRRRATQAPANLENHWPRALLERRANADKAAHRTHRRSRPPDRPSTGVSP